MDQRKKYLYLILFVFLFYLGCPTPPPPIPPTPETVVVKVCETSNLLPNLYCPKTIDRTFKKGEEPTTICAVHKKPVEYVELNICKTTSLLPNKYCPVIKKSFVKGTEPKTVCAIHKPSKSKIPLFVFIPDIITSEGDLGAFLTKTAESGSWGIRIFANYSWGRGWRLSPYVQTGTWSHPTTGKKFPLFDLQTWNPDYWARLKTIYLSCKEKDLEIVITVTDVRDMDKNEKYYSPWYCSLQALAPESSGGVYGEYLKPFHYNLARVLIEKLNASGVKFRVEIANEFSDLGWADEGHPSIPIKWYSDFVAKLKTFGIPASRMIHSGWKDAVYNQGGIFSAHRIVLPTKLSALSYSSADRPRILISGDGGFDGNGRSDAEGRKGVSVADIQTIGTIIETLKYYGYEFMDRGLWKKDNANADLDDFDSSPASAFTKLWQ